MVSKMLTKSRLKNLRRIAKSRTGGAIAVKVVNQRKTPRRIEIGRPILPKSYITTLRYVSNFDINNTVPGTVDSWIFRANGCYDPDLTGAGHQPRGFDTFMGISVALPPQKGLYEHFTVLNATCNAHFNVNNLTESALCAVTLQGTSNPINNKSDLLEGRYVAWKMLSPNSSSSNNNVIMKKYNTSSFLGVKNPKSNTAIRGTAGTDPAEEAYFVISTGAQNDSQNQGITNCTVVIDYQIYFSEPITSDES